MNKKGFSLIEMLASVAILSTIVALIVGTFFTNIRGQKKVTTLGYIKENGDYALLVIRRMIKNAKHLESCSSNSIKISNPDGGETTFECSTDEGDPAIASNSSSLVSSGIILSDDNCFDCDTDLSPPIIEVSFTLEADNENLLESASQNFSATITLRNY